MSAENRPQQPPQAQQPQQPMQILQPPRQQAPPPQQQQQQQQQPKSPHHGQRRGGGGGRSPGPGRGGQPQYPNPNQGRGRGGRGGSQQQQQQQQQVKPISLNPSSGIPYGHVPAYLPGSASLVEQLDQRVLIVLRDGKHIIGELSSFDQFSNMILKEAVERRFHSPTKEKGVTYYADIPLGVYVIRGDSVVILGNIHDDNQTNNRMPNNHALKQVSLDELGELQAKEFEKKEDEDDDNKDGPLTWDFDADLIA